MMKLKGLRTYVCSTIKPGNSDIPTTTNPSYIQYMLLLLDPTVK